MALKLEEKKSDLPTDATLSIASFLPLKYILKLKLLSTSWNSTISSNPSFALTHLQNSNSYSNLFLRQHKSSMAIYKAPKHVYFYLEKFQGGELKPEDEAVFEGPEGCDKVLCYCNGVLLLADSWYGPTKYALWNPSIGKSLDFQFPQELYNNASYGICYDPTVHDFKVVFIAGPESGVFSFKKNSWTEKTGFPYKGTDKGLYVDGGLYWVLSDEETRHVVYFDSRSDELKRLEKPKGVGDDDRSLFLACLDGDLYMYCDIGDGTTVRMWVKEKGVFENCWKEFVTIENVETPIGSVRPLCLMGGKKKMVVELEGERYVMYRFDDKTFEEVQEFTDKSYFHNGFIPYQESLLFPTLQTMHCQEELENQSSKFS